MVIEFIGTYYEPMTGMYCVGTKRMLVEDENEARACAAGYQTDLREYYDPTAEIHWTEVLDT